MAFASFALLLLAACGSVAEPEAHDVTRVPEMSDAAAQATREAPPPGASPTSDEEAAAAGPATAEAAPPAAAGAAEPVTIVSHDIFFDPAEVTIPANTDVTVSLPNEGVTPHNFAIDALGISVDIAPGATEEVVINAPEGTYEFYCNVPGHKEAGMVGTLVVSAEAVPGAAESATPAPAAPTAASATPEAAAATPAGAEPAATPSAATPVAPAAAAAAPVTVTSLDIFFEPDEVTIPANTDVTFILPNEGVAPHNFAIDELGISVDIAPGATEETVINAAPGTYEFYSNVPGHKEAGMVGTLIVTAAAAPAATSETPPESATPPAAGGQASPASATPAAAPPPAASPETAGPAAAAAAPVEVVSHDIFFEPDEVTIPANTDVAVSLPNEGVTLHNFAIDALGVSVDIAPGVTEQTVINAAPGTYEFYCNVPGHKEAGMVGTLTVE
jgi:uncharacterized cupredoxin-like copper-binding protein